jgi:hypothetical protein
MLQLPSPPRRAWLHSFWLALSFYSGVTAGILLAVLQVAHWFAVALLLTLIMAGAGFLLPQVSVNVYHFWNRAMLWVGRWIRLGLLAICYGCICLATAHKGHAICLGRPAANGSLWIARGTLAPFAYDHQYAVPGPTPSSRSRFVTYLQWAKQSGNGWAVCLLPFLLLLAVVDAEQSTSDFPANIYTLY